MAEPDELDVARARFPVGEEVTGRVARIPKPGVIGVFVDLGREPEGFVVVLHLPREPGEWPHADTDTTFEVLQHRPGQVRLFPLDDRFRSPDSLPGVPAQEQWLVIKDRFPVGSEVTATVTGVFLANREYVVWFEDCWSVLEWTGEAPRVGASSRYTVTRHLDRTRRIMITPVTPSHLTKGSSGSQQNLGCVAHQAEPMWVCQLMRDRLQPKLGSPSAERLARGRRAAGRGQPRSRTR